MRHATRQLDGRYRLVDLLAQGGVADVYRAVDESTGETVALKILRRRDLQLARRLQREVALLGRLRHPGLVRLVDSGTVEGHGYLVMELLEGGTLEDRLRLGPLAPAEVAEVVTTLAVGLDHVHASGVVHRDVKPANVLFDRDGVAHLGDFGIAQWFETATLTSNGTTLGTAAYMAPEQLRGDAVGPAADVWALGAVAIESLLGRRLFQGGGIEIVARRLEAPLSVPAEVPAPWRPLVEEMVGERPEARPSAAAVAARTAGSAFREEAGRVGGAGPVAGAVLVPPGPMGPPPATPWPAVASTAQIPRVTGTVSPRRRTRRALASSAAVAAVLAASAGFAWSYAGVGGPHASAYVHRAPPAPPTSTTTTTVPPSTTTSTTVPPPPTTAPPPPPTTAPAPVRGPAPAPGPGHGGGGQGGNH